MPSFNEFLQSESDKVVQAQELHASGPRPVVRVWTDGASRGNPGPGGYGAVLVFKDSEGNTATKELYQGYSETTNNRMELLALIVALEQLKRPCIVTAYSDSQYVCNGLNKGWVWGWRNKGWVTASKKPVKNIDLWKRLLVAMHPHDLTLMWVKGHAGNDLNERCDELATSAADGKLGALIRDKGFES